MSNHTAQDLLAAVGVDHTNSDYFDTAFRCSVCKETTDGPAGRVSRCYAHVGHSMGGQKSVALAPSYTYTGPALHTEELDAVLLVAGVTRLRAMCEQDKYLINSFGWNVIKGIPENYPGDWCTWMLSSCPRPGHALAAAIAEVQSC
jgi:hypothetical protein